MNRFSFPTPIYFGNGVRKDVAAFLKSQGFQKPLVVTDRGIADQPFFKEFLGLLEKGGLKAQAFTGIWGNPVKSQVSEGVKSFQTSGADSIIGLGGGAAIDVAKAIALMATHPGDLFDYEDEKPGAKPIDGEIPFWIAVPTTSGTGSEVGRSTVVSDDVTHLKKIIFSPKLLAKAVFADPELTVGMPAKITAATGMDALTHLIESYFAKGFHPICDGIAVEGFRMAAGALAKAVKNPGDLEARGAMLMASMMGAIAFQKGLGLTHSCAHALSTVADLHHGLANGVMIDHALRFNASAIEDRFVRLAKEIDLPSPSSASFLAWLRDLKKEIGIPASLTEAGLRKDQIGALVEVATLDVCHSCNPKPVTKEDFRRIFEEAFR